MKLSTLTTVVLGMTICAGTTACFTGVESTPRIDASTVKEQRASEPVAEASYLDDIRPQAPAKWKTGKRFRVADDRISLIFSSPSDASINLVGHDIEYLGREVGTSLTGADATILKFTDGRGRKFYYRPDNYDAARLDSVESLDVPFTIDLDVVETRKCAAAGIMCVLRFGIPPTVLLPLYPVCGMWRWKSTVSYRAQPISLQPYAFMLPTARTTTNMFC